MAHSSLITSLLVIVLILDPVAGETFDSTGRWWVFGSTEQDGLAPPGRQGSLCNVVDIREEPNGQGTDLVGIDVGVTATGGSGKTLVRPFGFRKQNGVSYVNGIAVGYSLIQRTDFHYIYIFAGFTQCSAQTSTPKPKVRQLCRTLNRLLLGKKTINLRRGKCPGYPASTVDFDLSLLTGKYFVTSYFGPLEDFQCAFDVFSANAASNKRDYTSTRIRVAQSSTVVTGTIEQDTNWSGRYTATDTGTTEKVPGWVVVRGEVENGAYPYFVRLDPARRDGTIFVHEDSTLTDAKLQEIKNEVAAGNPSITANVWVDIDNQNQCPP